MPIRFISVLQFHVKYAQVAELRQVCAQSTLVLLFVDPNKYRLICSQSSVLTIPRSLIHWVSKIDCVVSIVVFGTLNVDMGVDGVVGAIVVTVLVTLPSLLLIRIGSDVA